MNKAFEKIFEKLEEERELSYADFSRYVEEVSPCLDAEYDDFFHRGLERASRLVKEVAEEYNGGWIPCSVGLPKEKDGIVLICCEDGNVMTGKHSEFSDTWYKGNIYAVGGSNVIAWQPLPEPYKERD